MCIRDSLTTVPALKRPAAVTARAAIAAAAFLLYFFHVFLFIAFPSNCLMRLFYQIDACIFVHYIVHLRYLDVYKRQVSGCLWDTHSEGRPFSYCLRKGRFDIQTGGSCQPFPISKRDISYRRASGGPLSGCVYCFRTIWKLYQHFGIKWYHRSAISVETSLMLFFNFGIFMSGCSFFNRENLYQARHVSCQGKWADAEWVCSSSFPWASNSNYADPGGSRFHGCLSGKGRLFRKDHPQRVQPHAGVG